MLQITRSTSGHILKVETIRIARWVKQVHAIWNKGMNAGAHILYTECTAYILFVKTANYVKQHYHGPRCKSLQLSQHFPSTGSSLPSFPTWTHVRMGWTTLKKLDGLTMFNQQTKNLRIQTKTIQSAGKLMKPPTRRGLTDSLTKALHDTTAAVMPGCKRMKWWPMVGS